MTGTNWTDPKGPRCNKVDDRTVSDNTDAVQVIPVKALTFWRHWPSAVQR